MTMTTNPSSPLSAPVGVEGLVRLLERIRDLLASLPVDCLGSGTSASGQPYPIRDEVIHGITKALAQQPAAVDRSNAQTAEVETLLAELDIRDSIIATHAADAREYKKRISQAESRAERLAEALRDAADDIDAGVSPADVAAHLRARAALLRDQGEGK